MNHRDRRGSWATEWGRRGPRYHWVMRRGLAGFTPIRARTAPFRGRRAVRQFDMVPYEALIARPSPAAYPSQVRRRARQTMRRLNYGRYRSVQRHGLVVSPRYRASARYVPNIRNGDRQTGLAISLRGIIKLSHHRVSSRRLWYQSQRVLAHATKPGMAVREPKKRTYRAIAPVRRGADVASESGPSAPRLSRQGHQLSNLVAGDQRFAPGIQTVGSGRAPMAWRNRDSSTPSADHAFIADQNSVLSLPGHDMMSWLGRVFGDEARRPPSGPTRYDTMLSPIYPGRKPSF